MSSEPARLPPPKGTAPATPKHLRTDGRRLWRRVTAEYHLEAHHEAVLLAACESGDRVREAQAAVKKDGAYIEGRFGLKAHPALAVERDSRLAMLRALRELGLDYTAVPATQRTSAARDARWNR